MRGRTRGRCGGAAAGEARDRARGRSGRTGAGAVRAPQPAPHQAPRAQRAARTADAHATRGSCSFNTQHGAWVAQHRAVGDEGGAIALLIDSWACSPHLWSPRTPIGASVIRLRDVPRHTGGGSLARICRGRSYLLYVQPQPDCDTQPFRLARFTPGLDSTGRCREPSSLRRGPPKRLRARGVRGREGASPVAADARSAAGAARARQLQSRGFRRQRAARIAQRGVPPILRRCPPTRALAMPPPVASGLPRRATARRAAGLVARVGDAAREPARPRVSPASSGSPASSAAREPRRAVADPVPAAPS